jgi:long-chain acyl-CoA synthetase
MNYLADYTVQLAVVVGIAGICLYYQFGGGLGKKSRENYSVLVGEKPADSTKLIRNYRSEKGLVVGYKGIETIYQTFQVVAKKNPNFKCLGTRPLIKVHKEETVVKGETKTWSFYELGPYEWRTYAETNDTLTRRGSGFIELGLKAGQNVALYMETCADWTISAHACFSQSLVVMTVYANLGDEALVHGLNEAEVTHMVTSGDLLQSLSKLLNKLKFLTHIVYTGELTLDEKGRKIFSNHHTKLVTMKEVEELGTKANHPHNPPQPDDTAVLMYTSGSTGMPKGVMCTHRNCMSAIGGVLAIHTLYPQEVHLSYLPLAHILAFILETGAITSALAIAYGSPRTLADQACRNCRGDICEAAPNFLIGVPSVFDKIKAGILSTVGSQSAILQFLFNSAISSKKAAMSEGKDTPIWNKLVLNKLKAKIGGNVRFIVSGGAPLSSQCADFLRSAFGCPVLQGYGLTETCGGTTVGEQSDLEGAYSAGAPIASIEIKLVDCPKMNYLSTDEPCPRGEIWIRGANVTKGYYKMEEKTKEDFIDGWFKTGDIGQLNVNGTLSIIDRMKNLVKPPHGEYIAIEKLESMYKNCPLVANIMVFAHSQSDFIVALVHPNKAALEKKVNGSSWHDICESPEAKKAVMSALLQTWKELGLRGIEKISNVALYPDEWTPDNNWLTAAMKLKRPDILKDHKEEIQELYKELKSEWNGKS